MKQGVASVGRLVTARPWLTAIVVVALVAGGVFGYRRLHDSIPATASVAAVTSRLVTVATGTVQQAVSTSGTLTPADEEDLSFSSAATVTSVRVAQGDKVSKGQVLGTIDTLMLKATLAQTQAQLATARATLAAAEDDTTTAATQLTADRAGVTTARASVTAAVTALAAAVLRAPIAGTVAEVNVAKGETSGGSSSSGTSGSGGSGTGGSAGGAGATSGGTAATTTASTSSTADYVVIGMKKWTVSASVDDTEVGLIAKGDQVKLTTDNVTGTVFGIVSSVSVLSSSSSGSATYPVDIAVTGTPAGLHDGASATASIIYKQVTNVLTVPTAAVHTDTGTTSYVYVSANGKKAKVTVTTGLAADGTTQIKSGLTANQQVYVQTPTFGNRATTGGTGGTGGTSRTGGGYGNFGGGGGNYGGFGGGNAPAGFPAGGQRP